MEVVEAKRLDENCSIYKMGTREEALAFGAKHYTHDTGCLARFDDGVYAWASTPVWLKRLGGWRR